MRRSERAGRLRGWIAAPVLVLLVAMGCGGVDEVARRDAAPAASPVRDGERSAGGSVVGTRPAEGEPAAAADPPAAEPEATPAAPAPERTPAPEAIAAPSLVAIAAEDAPAFAAAADSGLATRGSGGGLSAIVHSRLVGDATVRFWLTRATRTGRTRYEYAFAASVQNRGTSALQGAVLVSSASAASRIVDPCSRFGVTPPGLTRPADDVFVVSQDRAAAFDPTALGFLVTATPNPTLCSDPGRVTLRRLNRSEYDNTVRDLLGTTLRPGVDFPTDDSDHGFDTIGSALSFSPLLFEKAERAATLVVEDALRVFPASGETQRFEGEDGDGECGSGSGGRWNLWSACALHFDVVVDYPGTYELRVRAWEDHAGGEYAQLQVLANGGAIGTPLAITAGSRETAQTYTRTTTLSEGSYDLAVEFLNDYYVPDVADRNVHIDWLEVVGPIDPPPPSPQVAALRALCDPQVLGAASCHRQLTAAFGRRAWRRPLTSEEVESIARLADAEVAAGRGFDAGLAAAMRALLTSPFFLFKVERDPQARSVEKHRLSDHELATRLSYFLWSSTPDDVLLDLADQGRLRTEAEISAQVHRMVADPRIGGFAESFGGQWLGLRALDDVNPDPALFPDWDESLRLSAEAETLLFLLSLVQAPRSFLDILDADYSYLNDTMARHYGLPLPGSAGPVHRVLPANGQRGGILGHTSLLAVNAQMGRTSPVKRGKWVLDQLLCIDIPPPPPGVEGMLDMPDTPITGTLRERLAQHRENPECATCHDYLDPLGLGLENYDAIGAWRTHDAGQPIDASGQMPDGRSFDGPEELAAMLKADPSTARCIVERVATYALGRGLEPTDDATLDGITTLWGQFGHRFEALLSLIAQSEPFRSRRGEPAGGTP